MGVDALLLTTTDQHGHKFLQNFRPHLTDLKNLLVVHLLLPTVVQRHLQHDTGLSRPSHSRHTTIRKPSYSCHTAATLPCQTAVRQTSDSCHTDFTLHHSAVTLPCHTAIRQHQTAVIQPSHCHHTANIQLSYSSHTQPSSCRTMLLSF